MKVLVIDDEPQIRRALRAGLEHNGYEVMLAANGEEGLDVAVQKNSDLLILDLALPGTDGVFRAPTITRVVEKSSYSAYSQRGAKKKKSRLWTWVLMII